MSTGGNFMNISQNAAASGGSASGGSASSSQGGSGAGSAAAALIGLVGGIGKANRQYHRQKKLMGVQFENQRLLNQQGHDLQMDMWNKTNYKAQLEHMRAAGLNPALMYGQAGQGGQTGSQGGGSAAGGNAAAEKVMDLNNAMLEAQIRKLRTEGDLDKAKEKDILNKLPESIRGIGAQADKDVSAKELNEKLGLESIERAKNVSEDTKLKAEQRLKTIIETKGQELKNKLDQLKIDKNATGSMFLDMMNSVGLDPTNVESDKWVVRGILTAYFGADVVSKVARAFPKGIADLIYKFFGIKSN